MEKDPSKDEPIYYEKNIIKVMFYTIIILKELYINLKFFNLFFIKKEKGSPFDEPVYYEKNIIKSFVLYYYYTKFTLVKLNILNKLYLKFFIFSPIK